MAAKKIACPLCRSGDWVLVDRLSPAELDYFYRQRYAIPITDHLRGVREIAFHECQTCSLKYFFPPIAGSHEFYARLNQFDWYYLAEKAEYKRAASLIPAGARVLDVGCGEGKFASWIRQSEYVGLELNLRNGEKGVGGPTILPESVGEHSRRYPAGYDVVCTFQVLEHVVEVSLFIEDCLRCLRPGGVLIVSVPAADSFVSQTVNGLLNLPPHHLSWWPDRSLSYISRLHDLTLEHIFHEPLERIHYRWYASVWAYGLATRIVGAQRRLLNRSLTHHLLSGLLLPLVLVRWAFLFILPRPVAGHSVVAVYRKGNSDQDGTDSRRT